MSDADYNLRVGITMSGEQQTSISTFRRTPSEGPSYLVVGFGPVLIYCCDPRAVLVHYSAFEQATAAARWHFRGNVGPDNDKRASHDGGFALAVSMTTQPTDTFAVTMVGAGSSRSHAPELVVTVGALILVCTDEAAVRSLHQLWNDAVTVMPAVWSTAARAIDLERRLMPNP